MSENERFISEIEFKIGVTSKPDDIPLSVKEAVLIEEEPMDDWEEETDPMLTDKLPLSLMHSVLRERQLLTKYIL